MKRYRRVYLPGGTFFFTLVTKHRSHWLADEMAIQRLRDGLREVMRKRPFTIDAIVVLPDHLHAIWRLPRGDCDYSTRWRLIKHFVRIGGNKAWRWQSRFWEHALRDANDWCAHIDYIHYNPVKHGYVNRPSEWAFSSFHRAVQRGWYNRNWGVGEPNNLPCNVGE